MNGKIRNAALAALFVVVAGPAAATAQNYQPDPRNQPDGRNYDQDYPNDYGDSDFRQTVARLSYIYGNVAFSRGDEPDEWQPADRNVPMTMGDRVWTANGRLELQIQGGNVVRMAKRTSLVALSLTEDTTQFSVTSGVASFKIGRLDEYEVFEVDTPNAAITFETPGEYRIDVREGYSRIQVRRGQASVASGGGQVPLGAGDALLLEGYDTPRYEFVPARSDGWDGWVQGREAQYSRIRSYEYVSPSIAGVEDLDRYGRWQSLPTYGWCWTPSSVAVGWAPYRDGRWMWQDPWGWTWVSTEQWGWAPYHYGRWVTHQSSWFWVPGQRAAYVPYRPALVAFVGAGPGFSVSVSVGIGSGYIGWFPLAPREPLIPWWGRPSVNVNVTNVTNITYVNRTYVTVVNEQTFVGGQAVAANYVRDRAIVNRVERASVLAGPIPIYPTRASLRTSTRSAPAPAPPAAVISRPVVARLAPPPAPPRFAEKSAVIRQNRGAPVNPVEAHRMAEKRDQLKPPVAVRPVAREAGRVELAPKSQTARTVQAQPVTAPRGRELATRERPVAPEPAPPTERRRQAPAAAPAPAPPPDRDIRERAVPTPAGRDREAAQDREVQQREAAQQQEREAAQQQQQREVQQREAAQQQREVQQREATQQQQREVQQREAAQQQQQREAVQKQERENQQRAIQQREAQQREVQQREAAQQQQQREAEQRAVQQREQQQREAEQRAVQQREQQQREAAQREAQQQEAARKRVTAPRPESAPSRGTAPTAVPAERVQPPPQVRERSQPVERVSPQPKAERPQNPPAEREGTPPSRQRGRVTPKPTPTPGG